MATVVLPSKQSILREIHKRSFYEFSKYFWSSVAASSTFLEPAKHIEAICLHLQKQQYGEFDELSIEIPPGHGKSRVTTVLYPAWIWGPVGRPEAQIGCSTNSLKLTRRDLRLSKKLMESEAYQELYGHCFSLTNATSEELYNDKDGYRYSMSNTSSTTGWRFTDWIGDDLLNAPDIESPEMVEQMNAHLQAIASRGDITKGPMRKTIIGQRLGEGDAGEYARKNEFLVLSLPLEYDPSNHCSTPYFEDWRKEPGELISPVTLQRKDVEKLKRTLLPHQYAAQYQQTARPKDGNIFKKDYFRFAKRGALDIAFTFQSIDTALSEKGTADMSAITTWGVFYGENPNEGGIVLLDTWADRVGIIALLNKIVDKANEFNPVKIVIENKVSGISVIQELEKNDKFRYPIEAFDPGKMSKSERANKAAPFAFRGHVWLYENDFHAETLLNQLLVFPNSKVRDLADSAVQAFLFADDSYTFQEQEVYYEGSSTADEYDEYSSDSYM